MAKKQSVVVTGYLFVYNVVQTIGWGWVLGLLVQGLVEQNWESLKHLDSLTYQTSGPSLWDKVGTPLFYFQFLAALEIVHSLLGLVPSPFLTTFAQVLSRLNLVTVAMYMAPAQACPYFGTMVLAWAVTETIRYSFYALSTLNTSFYPLTWLRYTLFYVLYPIGVASELVLVWKAVEHILIKALPLTNPIPFFAEPAHFAYLLIASAVLYLPGFPKLYFYMINQRKKVLNPSASSDKSSAAQPKSTPRSPKPKVE